MKQLQQILVDKYTPTELIEKLTASVDTETLVDIFSEEILFEFGLEGEFEDEWLDLVGEDVED